MRQLLKIHTTKLIILVGIIFCTLSIGTRIPRQNFVYNNSDATEQVLFTIQALNENPVEQSKLSNIMTLGRSTDKFIANGPSLYMDGNGNNFYVTYSPILFLIPYFIFHMANFAATTINLYWFNSFLLILSLFLIIVNLRQFISPKSSVDEDEKKIGTTLQTLLILIYPFLPEVMQSQGGVYWAQSLWQVILLSQLYFFFKLRDPGLTAGWKRFYKIIFFFSIYFFTMMDWSGIFAAAGFMLAEGLMTYREGRGNNMGRKSLLAILPIVLATVLSVLTFAIHLLITTNWNIHSLVQLYSFSFQSRSGNILQNLLQLVKGYWTSFSWFLILVIILLILSMAFQQSRKSIISKIYKSRYMLLILVVLAFENLILSSHASLYTFDRLKIVFLLFYFFSVSILALLESISREPFKRIAIMTAITVAIVVSGVNLSWYSSGNSYVTHVSQYVVDQNETYFRTVKNNYRGALVYLDNSSFRPWGYLQRNFNSNIYSSLYYSFDAVKDIARRKEIGNIIVLHVAPILPTADFYEVQGLNIYSMQFNSSVPMSPQGG